ncbi:MAG: phosphatidylserine decarboxylase family protein [Actinobacteria bacterium]|jgi:phosphatidylserine decarboxylase|uniref:Phosphatidylserine decarboxylase proenzyme n=3 Tax=root TaxID=1 RepID=A0ABU8E3M1_9ACTN|nr:phosphatidylserine decarboxylase [Klenkia terrae]MSW65288.1 phosphatidylserine decarboxylase family protein [Actinomycetota bacterium]SSC24779.1 Phosphatidylserine decarboxylase [Klenkia terrae]
MRIDRAGWPFITVPLAPAVALGVLGRVTGARGARLAAWPLVGLSAYMALFFRDPQRSCDTAPVGGDDVVSPADGMVMVAGPAQEGVAPEPAPEGGWQQVSIFLSVVDVHVNRSPYRGTVTSSSYTPGSFLAAYRAESAHRNERSEIWLADGDRTVVFRQLVGVLARRIVTRTGPGAQLATGERMGLMKFGSRMDVFLPADAVLAVTKGQRVRGGETVIARWGTSSDGGRP